MHIYTYQNKWKAEWTEWSVRVGVVSQLVINGKYLKNITGLLTYLYFFEYVFIAVLLHIHTLERFT